MALAWATVGSRIGAVSAAVVASSLIFFMPTTVPEAGKGSVMARLEPRVARL